LYYAEESAALGVAERRLRALGPRQREQHGALDDLGLGGKRHAFVELHGNIRAE
jgi:hypothetical protein